VLIKKRIKTEILSELDLFGKYIKCCIVEGMIEDIKSKRLDSAKLNEISIILRAMGMQNEYRELIGDISGNNNRMSD